MGKKDVEISTKMGYVVELNSKQGNTGTPKRDSSDLLKIKKSQSDKK